MTAPDAAPEPRTRVRRERSATESLLSIALLLEAILVFFIVMVAFGLRVLPAGLVFGGGAVLVVLLLVTGRLVGRAIGVWTGWVLQAALIALGILLPLMYFVGALFLAIWIYCVVTGRRLDRQKAAYLAEHPEHLTT
jgi:formate/nitrite transporter FocA (FNT family)